MSAGQLLMQLHSSGIRLWTVEGRLHYATADPAALTTGLRKQIETHKAELVGMLESARRDRVTRIPAASRDALVPVSYAQERFLFLDRLQGPSATFNLASSFHLRGELDVRALHWAIGEVVRRHEVLRTAFDTTTPVPTQRVTELTPPLLLVDLAGVPPAGRTRVAEHIARKELNRPFVILNGPHLRCLLLRFSPHEHQLLVVLHHIVCDGESTPVFLRELAHFYAARSAGGGTALEPLPIQFRDFASWQRSGSGESFGRHIEFWKERLRDLPALLQLPYDRQRSSEQKVMGGSVPFVLGDGTRGVETADGGARATEYHRLLAAFAILLHRYTGQEDLVIGSPVANRGLPETQPLIGPFLNILPIRLELATLTTSQQAIDSARRATLEALDHGDVPFEQIVHAARPSRDAGYAPLFQVMFAFESTPVETLQLPGLEVETHFVEDTSAKYDLTLVMHRRARQLHGTFKYNLDRFDRTTIERMVGHYVQIAESALRAPEEPFRRMSLGSGAEQRRLAGFSHGPVRPYPIQRPLHAFFEAQASRTPHAVALDFEGRTLDYDTLNRRANRLAHALIRLGVGPEATVAICMERSLEMVVATLGVLKAGGAYAPVDPEYPAARRALMVSNARASVVVTQMQFAAGIAADNVIVLDDTSAALAGESEENPSHRVWARNACYVIHTSGTTGNPKAVLTEHQAICNNLLWMQDEWPLDGRDVVLLKSSFSFDVSLKEIMWPLMFGAGVRIARPGGHRDPAYVHEVVRKAGVTVVHLVPSMLDYFLQHGSDEDSTLRIVMCGGEALSLELKNRFCARYEATLLHLYGPTEAAIAVTASTFTKANIHERVCLGRPMPNATIHILDQNCEAVPIGVWGELYIGGTPLARGYMNSPQLTAERFIPDAFATTAGARLYRTGDLARWRSDGTLEYLGRRDRQIKVRGLRIEPGEIEAAMLAHESVRQAAVTMRTLKSGAGCLAGYLVPHGASPDLMALRHFLRERLPAFMVPERLAILEGLPLSSNGKIDFDGLPDPPEAQESAPADTLPGDTDLEALIERAWRDVLGRDSIGHQENFFDAGGHSFAVARLQRRVHELCGREVLLTDLFAYPTIASLAHHLAGDAPLATQCAPAVRARDAASNAIAVIGMAARLPGARDLAQFWSNVLGGVESIRFFSPNELREAGVPESLLRDPNYVRARGVIGDIDQFDAAYFGFSAREADVLDPQLRLLLELSQHACDDAGYEPRAWRLRRKRCAVFASVSRSTYFLNVLQQRPEVLRQLGPQVISLATDKSFLATQIAYRLDLVGPCVTIDTACSSSLVAVHYACQSLRDGDADVALVGGASVDTPMTAGYFWQQGNIASPDGHCRPFDERASGTVKGSGGAVVVLKRLADALADGDSIRAVVQGSAVNNDGAQKVSYTAPSETGQAAVIAAAMQSAGVTPESIGYVETHGTGTALGDPIEAAALARVFVRGEVYLGSVKANIGHLDAAAGLSGFVKTALALSRGMIPPSINFTRANPATNIGAGPLHVTTQPRHWKPDRRRAGVSSFGIGGTNAHVIVEAPGEEAVSVDPREEIVLLSGSSAPDLVLQAERLAKQLSSAGALTLPGIALTWGRRTHEAGARRALIVPSCGALHAELVKIADEPRASVAPSGSSVRVAWLLPETTRADVGLISSLRLRCPVFEAAFDECEAAAKRIRTDRVLSFALTYALIRSLSQRGVRSVASLASGTAEIALAASGGALTLEDAMHQVLSAPVSDPPQGEAIASLAARSDVILALCDARTLCETLAAQHLALERRMIPLLPEATADAGAKSRPFLKALGTLWERGVDLTWPEFADRTRYRRASLPATEFRRRRHWIDANPHMAMAWTGTAHARARERRVLYWSRASRARPDHAARHWFVAGEDASACRSIAQALRDRGCLVALPDPSRSIDEQASQIAAWGRGHAEGRGMVWIAGSPEQDDPSVSAERLICAADALTGRRGAARLCVCTRGAFEIIGEDRLALRTASLHAVGEVAAAHGGVSFLGLDLDGSPDEEAGQVADELLSGAAGIVGRRKARRWSRAWRAAEPVADEAPMTNARVFGTTCLVGGGLTARTFDVATFLAGLGQPHLLIGPSVPAAREGPGARTPFLELAGEKTRVSILEDIGALLRSRAGNATEPAVDVHGIVYCIDTGGAHPGSGHAAVRHRLAHAERQIGEIEGLSSLSVPGIVLTWNAFGPDSDPAARYAFERCRAILADRDRQPPWSIVDIERGRQDGELSPHVDAEVAEVLLGVMQCASGEGLWIARVGQVRTPPSASRPSHDSGTSEAARVRAMWCDLLGLERDSTGSDSEFFACGGNSLIATQLMQAIEEATGRRVSLAAFLEQPTLGRLLALAQEAVASEKPSRHEEETEAFLL